ncbi:HGGxSTG domain-containing protein [Sphingomonas sp. IC-56]|uniref:HGGxSTG domain-containing protein n=1 Tax=Sphingomonas sp. IC-56 TaxID=2898529 RepID=UPI003FA6B9F1
MQQAKQPPALKAARRCLARTRKGSACQSPAMPNGRCRLHGGPSPGVPGNQNALKHGRYSREAIEMRRMLREMRRDLREGRFAID